jgi:RNA recognition motif-containing protein
VRIERARTHVEAKRMREAQKAYEAAQYAIVQQAASTSVTSVPTNVTQEEIPVASGDGMDVDVPATSTEPQGKRKASDEPEVDGNASKKVRMEPPSAPLKRDRENCTVFVADLPAGTSEEQLKALFKDCGEIREIKITNMPEILVGTVEFAARESIPAALTKDKKRIEGTEVNVHLAWRSTLYVTNFPEKTDDFAVRDLFGQYGLIFDVRWPSKKFKATRRFCYLQFTSPASAERALELHGHELEPERSLSVYISNPERKKDRTDADADEREVYVAGLSKFTNREDLQGVFSRYGPIKDIRLAEDKNGQSKGFAFVEFENEADARAALSANNYELKKRRIAVTIADTRVRSKNREGWAESGLGRRAEARNRTVRIRNLPSDTQEGLLHQALEKYATVKRTELFADIGEAVVELANAAVRLD